MENEFIINIDTMNEIALNARSAFTSLNDCSDILNTVVTHDDWSCKERDAINDCILAIKSNAVSISEAFEMFANAVNVTADRYIEMLNSEQNDILEINQTLGNLFALTCVGIAPAVSSGAATAAIIGSINNTQSTAFDCNSIYDLNNPIQLTSFAEASQLVTGS